MKVCSKCRKEKSISEFRKNRCKKDGLCCYCKKCDKEYQKKYYQRNRKRIINRSGNYYREYTKKYSKEIQKWIRNIKLQSGCEICDYNKCSKALVFHHRNPDEKELSVSQMSKYSKKRILEEIKKCQILCMNCHQELHAKLHYKEKR